MVQWDVDIDVLEVVFACSAKLDATVDLHRLVRVRFRR
jgi:hypothetical protein